MLTGSNTPGIERIRQWFHHPNKGMVVIVSSLISLFVSRMLSLGIDTWTHLLLASMQWFWRLYLLITLYSGTSIMVSTTAGALYVSGTSSWCSFHVCIINKWSRSGCFFPASSTRGGGAPKILLVMLKITMSSAIKKWWWAGLMLGLSTTALASSSFPFPPPWVTLHQQQSASQH